MNNTIIIKFSPLIIYFFLYRFRKWHESGLYERLFTKIDPKPVDDDAKSKPLGYSEMFTAFALLGFCMTMALLTFGVELIMQRGRNKSEMDPMNFEKGV